jgi:hypothetical protein
MSLRVAVLALVLAGPLWAQDGGPGALPGALRAYRDLEFDVATSLLRRALAQPQLDDAERARALTYLGAAEYYRQRRDSAIAVFQRLVVLAPRHRPDTLVFPPDITRLYDEVRRRTGVVAIRVPADTAFTRGGRLVAWLYPSAPHKVTVAISREDGRLVRTVYAGPVGDSLDVRWDGLDSSGALVTGDRLWLTVASPPRLVRVPLRVEAVGLDTLPHPAPLGASQLLPERADRGTALRSLGGGLLLAAGALTLPSLVAPGERASGTRFAVAGALGVSGLVGYLSRPAGQPLPENATINRARRDAWRLQAEAVARTNAARMREARLHIRTGTAVVLERGSEDQ